MAWRTTSLRRFLLPRRLKVPIEAGQEYRQITVKLWGKGLALRQVCDGSEIAAEQQVQVHAGDFLISKIDARHGAFGIVPSSLHGGVVSADFPCFEVDSSIVCPVFFEWLSKTQQFIEKCKLASKGSTNRVRLNEDRFLDLTVDLPPIEKQREIAAGLTRIQSDLAERSEALAEIELQCQRMLERAFFEIVSGAKQLTLDEVAPLIRRQVQVEIDGEYAELGIRSFGKGTFDKPTLSGADVGSKRIYEIHAGDLLLSNVFAWEGAIAVPSNEDHGRVGSHRFMTFRPTEGLATANFLRYYLLSHEGIEKVRSAYPGGAGRNRTLGIKKAEKITVPVPSIDKQRRFDDLQQKVDEIRSLHSATREEVEAFLPAVLNSLFGGSQSVVESPKVVTLFDKLPSKSIPDDGQSDALRAR